MTQNDSTCDWHEKGVCRVIEDAIMQNVKAIKVETRNGRYWESDESDVKITKDDQGKINSLFPSTNEESRISDVIYSCCHEDDPNLDGLKKSSREKLEKFSDENNGMGDVALLSEVMDRLVERKIVKIADAKRCFSNAMWETLEL